METKAQVKFDLLLNLAYPVLLWFRGESRSWESFGVFWHPAGEH